MRRLNWLLYAAAGFLLPWVIAFAPSPGAKFLIASPPQAAAWPAPPADDQAAALRRQQEAQIAHLDEMIAYRRQLLADMEAIADLVPPEYRLLCVEVARQTGLPPRTLAALGWVESRWNPQAVGSAGEIGIMQIMPDTGKEIAHRLGLKEFDLADPATNVYFGAVYLRQLVREHGTLEDALAAYNGGPRWRERAPQTARGYAHRVRQVMNGGDPGD